MKLENLYSKLIFRKSIPAAYCKYFKVIRKSGILSDGEQKCKLALGRLENDSRDVMDHVTEPTQTC